MLVFELVVSLTLLVFSIGLMGLALNIPLSLAPNFTMGAGGYPMLLGILLALLSIWWSADMVKQISDAKKKEANTKEKSEKISFLKVFIGDRHQQRNLIYIVISSLVFVFVLVPVCGKLSAQYGFILASLIFLTVTIKLFTNEKMWKVLLISAITSALVYFVFHTLLLVIMPR
ncbi:MAG: tripartite tricarboxylate transporter TctB family protein [Christensenellales bacterium]